MANEATVRVSLQIAKTVGAVPLSYQSGPTAFQASVATFKGPTPGAFTASLAGTDVNLSNLDALGGLAVIKNLDPTNYVTVGTWDPVEVRFHPMIELLPGEIYVVRLSRILGQEPGTGTHIFGTGDTLRVKANAAPCNVSVEAFDP